VGGEQCSRCVGAVEAGHTESGWEGGLRLCERGVRGWVVGGKRFRSGGMMSVGSGRGSRLSEVFWLYRCLFNWKGCGIGRSLHLGATAGLFVYPLY
jgi:hypothetical protein